MSDDGRTPDERAFDDALIPPELRLPRDADRDAGTLLASFEGLVCGLAPVVGERLTQRLTGYLLAFGRRLEPSEYPVTHTPAPGSWEDMARADAVRGTGPQPPLQALQHPIEPAVVEAANRLLVEGALAEAMRGSLSVNESRDIRTVAQHVATTASQLDGDARTPTSEGGATGGHSWLGQPGGKHFAPGEEVLYPGGRGHIAATDTNVEAALLPSALAWDVAEGRPGERYLGVRKYPAHLLFGKGDDPAQASPPSLRASVDHKTVLDAYEAEHDPASGDGPSPGQAEMFLGWLDEQGYALVIK